MSKLLPFLRARLAERSTRIQVVTLLLLALVGAGVVTIEQVHAYAGQIMALVAVLSPLATALVPDFNHDVAAEAQVDAAVDLATAVVTQAAEQAAGEGAKQVGEAVASVATKLGL